MDRLRRNVLNGINSQLVCYLAGSIHSHKGSIKVIRKFSCIILIIEYAIICWMCRFSFDRDEIYVLSSCERFLLLSSDMWNELERQRHYRFILFDFSGNEKSENFFHDSNFCLFFLRYGRWVTRRVAVATIISIWLLAAFVSFVPISLSLHRPNEPLSMIEDKDGKEFPTCALDLSPTYAVVSSCISFYVPCIVMIGIYCRWASSLKL